MRMIIFGLFMIIVIFIPPIFGDESQLESSDCGPGSVFQDGLCISKDYEYCDPEDDYAYDCGIAKESIFMAGPSGVTMEILRVASLPLIIGVLVVLALKKMRNK